MSEIDWFLTAIIGVTPFILDRLWNWGYNKRVNKAYSDLRNSLVYGSNFGEKVGKHLVFFIDELDFITELIKSGNKGLTLYYINKTKKMCIKGNKTKK